MSNLTASSDVHIALVNPPGAAIERPSIGLGTLKAVLRASHFTAIVEYANLWYADDVGVDNVTRLIYADSRHAVVDWVFSDAAFQTGEKVEQATAQYLAACPVVGKLFAVQELSDLRAGAQSFIAAAARRILSRNPRIVGCSSTFSQHTAALALLREIRKISPNVITVMGGANCESIMGETTHRCFDWVDYVVSGEAETVIVPLVEALLEYRRDVAPESLPPGVWGPAHREGAYPRAEAGDGVPRLSVRDMASVPCPDYDDYFEELDRASFTEGVEPGLLIESSRGCWWGERVHCTFCGLNGGSMQYRSKPAAKVLQEMQSLATRHRIRRFEVVDNIFSSDYYDTLLPLLIEANSPFELFYELKSNARRDQVRQLSKAGVRWIQPGIESLSNTILRLIRKGATSWGNIALLKWCRQFGVRVDWNLLYGIPGEPADCYSEQARILPLLHHLEPASPAEIQYCRYSPYFTNASSYGLKLTPGSAYPSIYRVSDEDLFDLVYFFDAINNRELVATVDALYPFLMQLALWRRAWSDGAPPVCCLIETTAGGGVVIDTRSCAVAHETRLDRAEIDALNAAESGALRHQLLLESSAAAVDRLIESRFLAEVDGRLVSVVLSAPIAEVPADSSFPGGYIHRNRTA